MFIEIKVKPGMIKENTLIFIQLHPFPKIEERSPEYKATPKSEDLDGAPIEDLDGTPLALDPAITFGKSVSEDIDGDALSEDLDGLPCKTQFHRHRSYSFFRKVLVLSQKLRV